MICQSFETECGYICVYEENGHVTQIKFNEKCFGKIDQNIAIQIEDYLQGRRQSFNFPVKLGGTAFQKKVWTLVREIPYGHTETYKQLSEKLKTSPRAIGQALKANPLPVYFPCHRVVAKKSIGGFTGGIEWKKMLLKIEGCNF